MVYHDQTQAWYLDGRLHVSCFRQSISGETHTPCLYHSIPCISFLNFVLNVYSARPTQAPIVRSRHQTEVTWVGTMQPIITKLLRLPKLSIHPSASNLEPCELASILEILTTNTRDSTLSILPSQLSGVAGKIWLKMPKYKSPSSDC